MEDLFHPNLAKRAIMEDLYQLNLNGTSKNEKSLSVKVKLKRAKMEEPLSVQLILKELKWKDLYQPK